MKVFVDTSAFYAFLERNDPHHANAVAVFTRAVHEGWSLVTTNYVVHETWALMQNRLGWDALETWLPDVLSPCAIAWVDQSLHSLGAERCRHARERNFSLTDGVSLAYMRHAGIRHAIAFDRHFERDGIRAP